jgi:hypothetical protein
MTLLDINIATIIEATATIGPYLVGIWLSDVAVTSVHGISDQFLTYMYGFSVIYDDADQQYIEYMVTLLTIYKYIFVQRRI